MPPSGRDARRRSRCWSASRRPYLAEGAHVLQPSANLVAVEVHRRAADGDQVERLHLSGSPASAAALPQGNAALSRLSLRFFRTNIPFFGCHARTFSPKPEISPRRAPMATATASAKASAMVAESERKAPKSTSGHGQHRASAWSERGKVRGPGQPISHADHSRGTVSRILRGSSGQGFRRNRARR
jgi:hypothetical protein